MDRARRVEWWLDVRSWLSLSVAQTEACPVTSLASLPILSSSRDLNLHYAPPLLRRDRDTPSTAPPPHTPPMRYASSNTSTRRTSRVPISDHHLRPRARSPPWIRSPGGIHNPPGPPRPRFRPRHAGHPPRRVTPPTRHEPRLQRSRRAADEETEAWSSPTSEQHPISDHGPQNGSPWETRTARGGKVEKGQDRLPHVSRAASEVRRGGPRLSELPKEQQGV